MKFTYQDIMEIRDKAIKRFSRYPTRHRLDGMTQDLNTDDQRVMAFFEAAVEVLNNKGVLDATKLAEMVPHPYTAGHEVVDDETYGGNVTKQK